MTCDIGHSVSLRHPVVSHTCKCVYMNEREGTRERERKRAREREVAKERERMSDTEKERERIFFFG